MPPAPGVRIGPYEVIAPLGAGGMGEVYRARDQRLQRDVALKIVAPRFALDAVRLNRFAREAQVLASLNHPNIATLYGSGGDAGASRRWSSSSSKVRRSLIGSPPNHPACASRRWYFFWP